MTKTKSTKSALFTSVVSLFLCFSMLLGTTFAWFTDSVTSDSNVIKSGNLDIAVEYTLDGKNWNDLDGAKDLFQNGLWEPGHTEVVALRITNNGSLALKYAANMNIVNETVGKNKDNADIVLSEILTVSTLAQQAIDENGNANQIGDITLALAFSGENSVAYENTTTFKAGNVLKNNVELQPGAAHYLILKVDMAETVGNEANAKDKDSAPSIKFGINVLAAQLNSEEDSFDANYDVNAEYPSFADTWDGTVDKTWYNDTDTEFTLSTAEELAGLAELANSGNNFSKKTIVLDSNIDFTGNQWTPIKKFAGTLNGNDHYIGNFKIDATTGHGGFIDVLEWGTIEDLTLTDITATVGNYRFGALARNINQSNIDNVTVKNVNVTTTASTAFVAGLFAHGTVNSNMEVNNCTVENLTVNAESGASLIGGITTFVQKNGTEAEGTNVFENLNVKNFKVTVNDTDGICGVGGLVGQTQSVWQNPRFNNCTVTGFDVTATGMVDVGGFMCYPGSVTFAENCSAEGKIDVSGVTSEKNFAGGFFGNYGWGDNIGKGDHKVTSCYADVDITTKYASAGGFVGSGTNSEGRNKNITLTNCEAKGNITLVDGGTANIGGFAGQTDRGIYVNCSAAQAPFIGKVLDGYTLNDDGNGTLTVTKI